MPTESELSNPLPLINVVYMVLDTKNLIANQRPYTDPLPLTSIVLWYLCCKI